MLTNFLSATSLINELILSAVEEPVYISQLDIIKILVSIGSLAHFCILSSSCP